ncbi:MAG: glycosyltransferase family 9 protein [Nitrospirae bacterium]|nr:MAG: glycosyltransferase family 9 protein [Nitrospirota bacterium]
MNWKLVRIIDSIIGIPLIRLISLFLSFRNRRSGQSATIPPKKILLVKFWGIGNIFMLLPSIQALRNTFPEATIDFLTLENNREALNMLGVVDRITAIDTGSIFRFLLTWQAAAGTLAAERYDLAIDFEQFARFAALVTFHSGASRTIGFSTSGQHRHHLFSDPVPYDDTVHITRTFYSLTEQAGVQKPFTPFSSLSAFEFLNTKGRCVLDSHGIPSSSPLMILHIGTSRNFRERRWPPQRYAELAELLAERHGFRIILTGLPEEAHLTRKTRQCMKSAGMVHDLGGRLTFADYFALIALADIVISADTSAIHMASAVNTPVIGLYGPNTPRLYGPWGENGLSLYAGFSCSPCITNYNAKDNICRHPDGRGACMQALSVEMVFNTIEEHYLLPNAPWLLNKLKGSAQCA